MISKEEFKRLVDIVVNNSGQTQEELALAMGYGKNYISEVMTPTGQVSAKFLNAFKFKFANYLENPNMVQDPPEPYRGAGKQKDPEPSDDMMKRILLNLSESFRELTNTHAKTVAMLETNLNGIVASSQPSQQRTGSEHGVEGRFEKFLDKEEIDSPRQKKRGRKKDIA